MTDVPLHLLKLIARLFLEAGGIARFVYFEEAKDDAALQVILATVVDCQVEQHVGHGLLVDVLEVLKGIRQHLVIKRAVVAKVDQDLPRLEELRGLRQMVEAGPEPDERVGGVLQRWIQTDEV